MPAAGKSTAQELEDVEREIRVAQRWPELTFYHLKLKTLEARAKSLRSDYAREGW